MRRFQQENFPTDAAEALNNTYRYDIPNKTVNEALSYVNQFIVGPYHSKTLVRGYLPDHYADALVNLRDNNNSRKLNQAVSRLCVNGATSQEVKNIEGFAVIELPPREEIRKLKTKKYSEIQSQESKQNASTLGELITHNQHKEKISMYVPDKTVEEFTRLGFL